jgi:hypothetical protein
VNGVQSAELEEQVATLKKIVGVLLRGKTEAASITAFGELTGTDFAWAKGEFAPVLAARPVVDDQAVQKAAGMQVGVVVTTLRDSLTAQKTKGGISVGPFLDRLPELKTALTTSRLIDNQKIAATMARLMGRVAGRTRDSVWSEPEVQALRNDLAALDAQLANPV